jgi:hypothetical protein
VVSAGAMIAMWGGRCACAAFLVSGGSHLIPPPAPLPQELHALFLCSVAMVPLVTGEFIAAYLAMLATTTATAQPSLANRLADVQALQQAVRGLLTDVPKTIKEMFKATVGLSPSALTPR